MQVLSLRLFLPLNLLSTKNKRLPLVMQYSETECGIASLAMILAYYQLPISLESLRDQCGVSRDGCSAKTLIDVAHRYGFYAVAYRVEWEDIKDLCKPFIAFWNFNHYVVVMGLKNGFVQVNDPALGRLILNKVDFNKAFTGIIIDVQPVSPLNIPQPVKNKDILQGLFAGCYWDLLFLFITLIALALTLMLNTALSKILFDDIITCHLISWLWGFLSLSLLISAIYMLIIAIKKHTEFSLLSKLFIIKSADIVDKVFKLPMIFYSLRQLGDIVSIFTRLELILSNGLSNKLAMNVNILLAISLLSVMLKINLTLTCIFLMISTLYLFSWSYIKNIIVNNELLHTRSGGKYHTNLLTSINNIETIKSTGYETQAFNRWHNYFIKKLGVQCENERLTILINESDHLYYLLLHSTLFFFGAKNVLNAQMSVGTLMGYYGLSVILSDKVIAIFSALRDYQIAAVARGRMNDLVNYSVDQRFLNHIELPIDKNNDSILDIKALSFSYNIHAMPILNNIEINIKPGEQLALIGETGSGKSTLAKLLCGFYLPNKGSIKLFGKCISNYPPEQLAQLIAYVSQDISLFSGTLLDNITLFGEYNEKLMKFALSVACLDELVNERGLLAKIEEGGTNFSGGEKQRIEIARAIYQNTPILILDEGTSALDRNTQDRLITNLSRLNKTIIYVAHRLSSISHCRIIMFENGKIIEQNNASYLMHSKNENLLC